MDSVEKLDEFEQLVIIGKSAITFTLCGEQFTIESNEVKLYPKSMKKE